MLAVGLCCCSTSPEPNESVHDGERHARGDSHVLTADGGAVDAVKQRDLTRSSEAGESIDARPASEVDSGRSARTDLAPASDGSGGEGLDSAGSAGGGSTDGARTEPDGSGDSAQGDIAASVDAGVYFEHTRTVAGAIVSEDYTYHNSPTAIIEQDDAEKPFKVWTASQHRFPGQTRDPFLQRREPYNDAIFATFFQQDGQAARLDGQPVSLKQVVFPTGDIADWDGASVSAPSVVRTAHQAIEEGAPLLFMYHECSTAFRNLRRGGVHELAFTQICLSVSRDGVTWQRYNEDYWKRYYRLSPVEGRLPAAHGGTPVIPAVQKIKDDCGYRFNDASEAPHEIGNAPVNLDCFNSGGWPNMVSYYGSGHPSATIVNGRIFLFHWNSMGDWGKRGVYLAKSWDGLHFEDAVRTNLMRPTEVKWFPRYGLFIGVYNNSVHNGVHFVTSRDGVTWDFTTEADSTLSIGRANEDLCIVPSVPTIVSNGQGNLSSEFVRILTSEGYRGGGDRYQGCVDPNGIEQQSRGSTWKTYELQGFIHGLT